MKKQIIATSLLAMIAVGAFMGNAGAATSFEYESLSVSQRTSKRASNTFIHFFALPSINVRSAVITQGDRMIEATSVGSKGAYKEMRFQAALVGTGEWTLQITSSNSAAYTTQITF